MRAQKPRNLVVSVPTTAIIGGTLNYKMWLLLAQMPFAL